MYSARDRIRFWSKVQLTAGGCAEWQGARSDGGYGRFWHEGRLKPAQVVAYEMVVGPAPPELRGADDRGSCGLHRCDNPPCVNPDHIRIGTHLDNMRDMDAKGRRASVAGVDNPRTRLSPEDVAEIRRLRGAVSQRELGRRYGVSKTQIGYIQRGQRWSATFKEPDHA